MDRGKVVILPHLQNVILDAAMQANISEQD